MKRGDVIIVDFSKYDPRDKVRPGVVVQNDRDNRRMRRMPEGCTRNFVIAGCLGQAGCLERGLRVNA